MAELQTIPAKHGVATFVPAGQTIKIVNTSGTQVVDTWAFALPKPDGEKKEDREEKSEEKEQPKEAEKPAPKTPKKGKKDGDLPSQEEAEQATAEGISKTDDGKDPKAATPQKAGWSSYVPSLGLGSAKKTTAAPKKDETEQQKNSKTWGSYFPSGKGFSSYIPKSAGDTVSAFASEHQRDTKKSYIDQLSDFSKTPVGAAGIKGFAAVTGSGYGGSLYAGYNAWNAMNAPSDPSMEFMSMPHSRAAMLHMRPRVNDTLVSNLREPMMVMVEDSSPGIHDTLMAACDPPRYKGLDVADWEHHGSCAENLVLALKELNERAGLKGAKAVGADVTINVVPAPLNLFMNIPWDDEGDLGFKAPKGKEGDYVRFRAVRDIVVVMSACPQDVLEINAKKPTDAHFVVEDSSEPKKPEPKAQPAKKRPAPKKLSSSRAQSTATTEVGDDDAEAGAAKKPAPKRAPAPKKPASATASQPAQKKPAPKPVQKKAAPESTTNGEAAPPAEKKKPAPKSETNGDATPPVEKKKPRKLAARPKAAAPKAEGAGEKSES